MVIDRGIDSDGFIRVEYSITKDTGGYTLHTNYCIDTNDIEHLVDYDNYKYSVDKSINLSYFGTSIDDMINTVRCTSETLLNLGVIDDVYIKFINKVVEENNIKWRSI